MQTNKGVSKGEGTSAPSSGDYGNLGTDEVLSRLHTDASRGLNEEDALRMAERGGFNEITEKRTPLWRQFGKRFWGLTAWMLELTMVLSFFLGKYFDLYIIAGLLVVNAIIGFIQEQKASSAVEALRKKLQINARVLREGVWKVVPARILVPGDIVRVRAGDFIPADLKLIEGELNIDQSALTGESMAVGRTAGSVLFSGSTAKRGEGTAVVVLTGPRTYFGKTVELLESARPKLHMEQITSRIVTWLLVMVFTLIAVLLGASYLRGVDILSVLPLALVLIVFAVPVALPAMFTVSMAIGSLELVSKGVLITRLSASEDAASMDTLCVDKTGTITSNRLSVASVIPLGGVDEDTVLTYGALASHEADQDPIDLAFLAAAGERKLKISDYRRISFTPFDPSTRRTEAIVRLGGTEIRAIKGAVRTLAALCGTKAEELDRLHSRMDDFASKGYRTLAVAHEVEGSAVLDGIVALYDAPRPDSGKLISELNEHGISVKMLTGDALSIAKEVARQVGLGESIISMGQLKGEIGSSPEVGARMAEKASGFAEIFPEDKYLVVKNLQSAGHIVGMTGDGINDSPALKQAEVGIAVSNATDVAKGAASAVLTNEGLTDIVTLVETGRKIYQRIVTWTLNKIVKTFEVAVFIVLAFLVTGDYVISALGVLLLLFANDFVTISVATDRVRWSSKPEKWDITSLVKISLALSMFTIAELFGLLFAGINLLHISPGNASFQTFGFSSVFYFAVFTILTVRERRHFWNSRPSGYMATALLVDVIAIALISTIGLPGLAPIGVGVVAFILAYAAAMFFGVNDFAKYLLMERLGIRR